MGVSHLLPALAVATLGSLLLGAGSAAGANVLVVGDSLSLGTAPYLERELGGVPIEVDAVVGRPSPSGVTVLARRLRPDHDVVVFDLGTNDGPSQPGALATSLAQARQLVGDRCMVVATISRPAVGGATVAGQNRVVRSFAAAGNVQVVEWRAAVDSDPGMVRRDGVHANAAGYALRGGLFAQAIGSCLNSAVAGIPAPHGDVSAHRPVARPRAARRHPARIDWLVLGAWPPVQALQVALRGVLEGVATMAAQLREAVAGAGPEPVLGATEAGEDGMIRK